MKWNEVKWNARILKILNQVKTYASDKWCFNLVWREDWGGGTFFWDPEKYMTYCGKDKPRTEENELGKCELGKYSGKERKLERDQLKFIPPILWTCYAEFCDPLKYLVKNVIPHQTTDFQRETGSGGDGPLNPSCSSSCFLVKNWHLPKLLQPFWENLYGAIFPKWGQKQFGEGILRGKQHK